MSETGRSGINRAFSWLKKTLEITEKTIAPDLLLPQVRPTIDVFGWERLPEATVENRVGTAATSTVTSTLVPDDVVRVILEAQVVNSDAAIAINLWLRHRAVIGGGFEIGVSPVFEQQIGFQGAPASIDRIIVLQQGERLVGVSSPAPGAGEELTLTFRFIDLPVGEYIAYLS